ncbi:MAG TPA: N-formylglutamate amidohydrolase [Paucimonas sp.]|nr:N-formylglutamate amidohydrolase [Paucimonas sp.]
MDEAQRPWLAIVTCEHGGNHIPLEYRDRFRDAGEALRSHRGYDAGALTMARDFADALQAPLFASTTSRLLIDLNRSLGHPGLYSEYSRTLAPAERRRLVESHYLPHRQRIEEAVAGMVANGGRVVHLASHSFTPELNGKVRNADIGLLYDPGREEERRFCRGWGAALGAALPGSRTRFNYPYAGKSDGLATFLRRRFAGEVYIGVEVEINQGHVMQGGRHWRILRERVVQALLAAMPAGASRRDKFPGQPTERFI